MCTPIIKCQDDKLKKIGIICAIENKSDLTNNKLCNNHTIVRTNYTCNNECHTQAHDYKMAKTFTRITINCLFSAGLDDDSM